MSKLEERRMGCLVFFSVLYDCTYEKYSLLNSLATFWLGLHNRRTSKCTISVWSAVQWSYWHHG